MPDWQDILEGISGGFMGVTKGLTAGAEPFNAWENVRTKDIANDKGEIQLRDLQLMQDALEAEGLGFYSNAALAKDAAHRKATSSANLDIFGNAQKLALGEYLADPNGAFQQGLKETGWTPGTPEYRAWLSEAISAFDPAAAPKVYDSFGVDKIENRNLNEQATLAFAQSWIQKNGPDPNAQLVRMPDGTVGVLSNGEISPVPGGLLTKIADMMGSATPGVAISKGVRDEGEIQKINIAMMKAIGEGRITPAMALKALETDRLTVSQDFNKAIQELTTLQKSQEYVLADEETKAAMVAPLQQRAAAARKELERIRNTAQAVMATGRLPGAEMPAPRAGPRPTGGSTVTAPRRPPPLAAGTAAAGALWGESSGGAPPYPPRAISPQDTGVRPITQGAADDPLLEFLRLIGAA